MRIRAALLGAVMLIPGGTASATSSGSPILVSPGSPVAAPLAAGGCPTFSWATPGDARAIELVVYRAAAGGEEEGEIDPDGVLRVTLPGTAAAWTPAGDHCLEPGERYAWSARAWFGAEPSAWSEISFFRVPGDPSGEEVRQALSVLERFVERGPGAAIPGESRAASPDPAPTPAAGKAPALAPTAAGPASASSGIAAAIQVDGLGVVTEAAMVLSVNDLRASLLDLNDPQQSSMGDDVRMGATMPFGIEIGGTTYTALTISSNGWVEFGGNTMPGSDWTNSCLPTNSTANPLLAAWWDDLELEGSGLYAGWIGQAPNRVYVIQWEAHPLGAAVETVHVQAQILEGSGLINVTYTTMPQGERAATATVGFQGAWGAAATAYPVICNGSLLWPAALRAGWSIAPVR